MCETGIIILYMYIFSHSIHTSHVDECKGFRESLGKLKKYIRNMALFFIFYV